MTDERHLREMLEDALGRVKRELEEQEQLTAQYKAKCESLKAWKESAIEVESEWDAQAIARMLGGRLGDSCRRVVAEKVPQLIARVAELERGCEQHAKAHDEPSGIVHRSYSDAWKDRAEAAEKKLAGVEERVRAEFADGFRIVEERSQRAEAALAAAREENERTRRSWEMERETWISALAADEVKHG